jgi:hypothetical protein
MTAIFLGGAIGVVLGCIFIVVIHMIMHRTK